VQTVSVAPGGATIVEFRVQVPGTYILVDHALTRLTKGAAGHMVVEGREHPEIYTAVDG
jgi:nitrite reductase (NO-forming)